MTPATLTIVALVSAVNARFIGTEVLPWHVVRRASVGVCADPLVLELSSGVVVLDVIFAETDLDAVAAVVVFLVRDLELAVWARVTIAIQLARNTLLLR